MQSTPIWGLNAFSMVSARRGPRHSHDLLAAMTMLCLPLACVDLGGMWLVTREGALGDFGDVRRAATGTRLIERVMQTGSLVIRKLGRDRAGEVAVHRFLSAASVTCGEMVATLAARTAAACTGRRIVAAQDTTEINFAGREERRRGLGLAGDGMSAGVFIHPVVAIDSEMEAVLGLLDARTWTRMDEFVATPMRTRALADQESIRWLDGAAQAGTHLAQAASVVVVADRESDIHASFARRPASVDLIVRAAQDRALHGGTSLFAAAAGWPELARTEVLVAPSRTGVRGRVATVALRAGPVAVCRPHHHHDPSAPPQLKLMMVEAPEVDGAGDGQPLLWRLLTTLDVADAAGAEDIVRLDRPRWRIEEIFRSSKADGVRLEDAQVQDAGRLFKLALAGLAAAARTLQLVDARDGSPRPATDVIDASVLPAAEAIPPPSKARQRASRTRIRPSPSPGCPGSSRGSAAGTATTSHPDPKPCAPDGHNSPPWPPASPSQPSQPRSQMCESRRFNDLYLPGRKSGPVTEAGCWAHGRRKLFDLAQVARAPAGRRGRANAIFDVERSINGLPAEQRFAVRQTHVAPLVADLEAWMRSTRGKMSRHAEVAKAMDYMLKRWDTFSRFLGDGRICLTNNAAERAARRGPRQKLMAVLWLRPRRRPGRGDVLAHRHRQAERHRSARLARRRAALDQRPSCTSPARVAALELRKAGRQTGGMSQTSRTPRDGNLGLRVLQACRCPWSPSDRCAAADGQENRQITESHA